MFSWFRRKPAPVPEPVEAEPNTRRRSDRIDDQQTSRAELIDRVTKRTFQRKVTIDISKAAGTFAMDDAGNVLMGGQYDTFGDTVSDDQLAWYGSQSFIGFQTCAILAQNWLIDRACHIPARDYCRNGWDIAGIDNPKVLDLIRKRDKAYRIKNHLLELVHFGRVFGIRFALPIVNGGPKGDPKFYENPFNIDGVKAGTYTGIRQIDPYWVSPFISGDAASNPTSIDFYEPTWWQVSGGKVHKSHLIIMRNGMVPDLLKPTYFYGGISIPQKISERVYAAERTANEAPLLAMSKRTTALHVGMAEVMANLPAFFERMAQWVRFRNNMGVKVLGEEEKLEQFDTSLADLSDVISGQYALVAAASGVPITKLMGSPPKGMNATGEYDEANYHEMLESIQEHDGTPLLDRHYQLMLVCDVIPQFPAMAKAEVTVAWKELDAMTAAEQATVNKTKADTDVALVNSGAIEGQDVRNRLIADPASGYSGIEKEAPKLPDVELDDGPRE